MGTKISLEKRLKSSKTYSKSRINHFVYFLISDIKWTVPGRFYTYDIDDPCDTNDAQNNADVIVAKSFEVFIRNDSSPRKSLKTYFYRSWKFLNLAFTS